jgi:hypothetical protein
MARADADRDLIRRLAHDVLQRGPRPDEIRTLVGLPAERVARHLLGRLEAMQQWVEEELYHHLLIDRFRPRTEAIDSLPERLRRGAADVRTATAEILLSTGFSLRNPGNDTFVTVVLEQCLGLAVQDRRHRASLEAGKRLYDGQPARFLGEDGRSQADVVRIVVGHRDFARHLLDRHHRRLFGAGLDSLPPDEAETLVAGLHEAPATFFTILAAWLGSERYRERVALRRPRTDRQFVRSLYVDVFEREPSEDELRRVRNALQSMADAAPLRAVVVKLVLGSPGARLPRPGVEGPAAFVAGIFERYLGRAPSQDELAAFTAILAEPGTDPALLIRALLTSPEYGLH